MRIGSSFARAIALAVAVLLLCSLSGARQVSPATDELVQRMVGTAQLEQPLQADQPRPVMFALPTVPIHDEFWLSSEDVALLQEDMEMGISAEPAAKVNNTSSAAVNTTTMLAKVVKGASNATKKADLELDGCAQNTRCPVAGGFCCAPAGTMCCPVGNPCLNTNPPTCGENPIVTAARKAHADAMDQHNKHFAAEAKVKAATASKLQNVTKQTVALRKALGDESLLKRDATAASKKARAEAKTKSAAALKEAREKHKARMKEKLAKFAANERLAKKGASEKVRKRQKEQQTKTEAGAKKTAEQSRKLTEKKKKSIAERAAKAKAEQKKKKMNQRIVGCQCRSQRVSMGKNRWSGCPSGYLARGMYRDKAKGWGKLVWWKRHRLFRIKRFMCCKPCRGSTPLQVTSCQSANWRSSLDRTGWSLCPTNTYLQALYRSGGSRLSNIENGRCCKIAGSRANAGCGDRNINRPFNSRGWGMAARNQFMAGLYRAGRGNKLYNLDKLRQCSAYAY